MLFTGQHASKATTDIGTVLHTSKPCKRSTSIVLSAPETSDIENNFAYHLGIAQLVPI